MTEQPDQNQPGPRPEPQVGEPLDPGDYSGLGVTDSPTVEQHSQMDADSGTTAPGELKGEALDQALEAAGLPKTGTADEKRARLADSQSGNTDQ